MVTALKNSKFLKDKIRIKKYVLKSAKNIAYKYFVQQTILAPLTLRATPNFCFAKTSNIVKRCATYILLF